MNSTHGSRLRPPLCPSTSRMFLGLAVITVTVLRTGAWWLYGLLAAVFAIHGIAWTLYPYFRFARKLYLGPSTAWLERNEPTFLRVPLLGDELRRTASDAPSHRRGEHGSTE